MVFTEYSLNSQNPQKGPKKERQRQGTTKILSLHLLLSLSLSRSIRALLQRSDGGNVAESREEKRSQFRNLVVFVLFLSWAGEMPMIRYQIRNEYGLADPELYGAAERDDPEALLEGVTMAGLVGVLRQLGDLAEFAAEIFHNLHEEVMTTAARGHGLMLRVQQLEAEFPSIEKAFFSQTNNSSFACNDGIDWHSNIEMDQNLITRGDMPRFIMDSYEECRGPPRLFTLDKFDVAGAGACLKRYSDPSFFKMELPSSRMLEIELPREKKARKTKKGSCWKNGQTLESLLAPHANSDLQAISSDQVSEKTLRRVRLKSRHFNGMERSNERRLMEHLLEIHSSEQNILFGNSVSYSHVKVNSIDSNESAPEIHEIVVDASADLPLVGGLNPIQSPIKKEVAGLSSYELETQKIKNKELSEALHDSFGELRKTDADYLVVEEKEMSTESGYKSESSVDGDVSGEPGKSSPALQVVNQNKLLGDAEGISEGCADGYRSDDVSSELDNFVDALNTIESDIETDTESGGKADPGVFNMESHRKDSHTNKAQQVLPAQFSEPDSVDNSTKSLSSDNVFKNEITSTSDSDSTSSTVAQPTQRNMVSFDLPANSEIRLGKTYEKTTETDFEDTAKSDHGVFNVESHGKDSDSNEAQQEFQAHFPAPDFVDNSTKSLSLNNIFKNEMACVSDSDIANSSIVAQPIQRNMVSIDLLANSEIFPGKNHDRTTEDLWQNNEAMELNSLNHFASSSCVIGSTSILFSIHPQASAHESQSITGDQNDLLSSNEAPDANEATEYLDGLPLESDHLAEHVEELISEDIAETFDMPDHLSQIEYRSMSREAPSGVGISPIISALSPAINYNASHLDGLATKLENGVQPEDIHADISSGFVEDSHDIAEEFDGSCPGTKDEDVPENIHPSDYPVELNSEDTTITLDMTNHHSQARDECTLGKVPTRFGGDSALPSNGCIGEPHESMKQDIDAYLGRSTSPTIPGLSPDISFTIQLEGSAAEMEKLVAPSEHLPCSSSSLENVEEMAKGNISMPNTLSPQLEYFSDAEEPQEFPHVVSAGFTHLYSVEETCPSDVQLQCKVPNHELIECPITVDNNLKLLDEPTECLSQENTLQAGGPTQSNDLTAENSIFNANSGNAHPSSTYSPETSGLLVQPQENSIPDDEFLYQHLVENQKTISPKDTTALDSQSTQHLTLPSSDEDQLVSAPTASDPELSILDSSNTSACRLLSDVCQTKLSGGVQEDLHSDNNEVNSVYSLESKQDFGLKALPHDGCESVEEKPPTIHFLSEPTIPLEEAASKSQVISELNVLPVHQEGEHLDPGIPTSSIDLNDEPSEQGLQHRCRDSASDGDVGELDIPPLNEAISGQVELETFVSSACSFEGISSSLASNISAVTLSPFTSFDVAILETSSQLPFEPRFDEPVSSFPLQGVEEPPPLPPLPPLEWRRGKLQLCSLSSGGNLFQPLSGTNSLMAPSPADWKHGHGLLEDEGEMVKPANPFVTMPVLEAKSSQHGLFKSDGEKMHPSRLSELPPIAGNERYQHDASFLEGKIVHPSNASVIIPVGEDEKHLSSHNAAGEVMLQPSNPFASLSVLEDDISQHPTLLQGETLQPSEDTSSQLDQLLTSLELEGSQESQHGHLSLERETVQPPNLFLVGSDIEDEKPQYGYGICGGENMQLQSSVRAPTTAPELPKLGCETSREENQSSQFDVLPTPDDENLNVKPRSICSRPRDPLIEAVAAHDRSTMRKVSEMVLPSNKPKADERDSLLEQIRNKSFNLKPAGVTKSNIKGPPTTLKVAAIIEKANAIRQAFVGSDEDNDEDSWTDS
ncbi:protein SCAR2-like isoform X2 [Phoenix dactylifera]|uniref:Protein SCAR2-like isoform X2 n=1 Tax=Phoenix dactylifera TaxID=42345 RepID=A0A8B7C5J9_PHODC|nr:protein SCAR2-like isoform X2 [Phoenix dactylifera]